MTNTITPIRPTSNGSEPILKKEGDTYLWLWPSVGYGIGFDQLRESQKEGLMAEVTVQMAEPVNGQRGLVHWARMSLMSTRSREEVTRACSQAVPKVAWTRMLELVCARTAEDWRRGAEFVNLANLDVPQRVGYLVERLLPEGKITGIAADGGTGKGYIALAVALALYTGLPLPGGLRPTKSVPVLYLDWEEDEDENKRRLDWLARGVGLSAVPDLHYRRMERPLADDIGLIKAYVVRHEIGFIVIDSIAPATGENPNDAPNAIRIMRALRTLQPATILFLAHVSHQTAQAKGSDRARVFGSVYYQNLARNIWEVRGEPEGDDVALGFYHGKTNVKKETPFGMRLAFDNDACTIKLVPQRLEDNPDLAERMSVATRLRLALKHGKRTTAELEEDTGIKADTIRRTLRRQRDVGTDAGPGGRGKVATWWLRAME